ncbi:hypothetical protein QRX50_29010 [Amycolatopsis carbonis]|uniref:Transporter n=1 Tax=Amycolatopsis carbonis TaxID=715471 RepID=A0A9Y2IAS1_9PSEU|nr:hypothetical protein [Amycolatopsis sp. 2-15]WIX75546.1 hypothetical protein QRX50_29010 [Amycolatopsis sp. 2-15]
MDTGFNILQSLQSAFTTFVGYLPQVIGALLVLLIGFIIAKLLDKAITKGLKKAKVDDKLKTGGGANYVEKFSPQGSPSKLVGMVVFWVIMFFVISSAIGTLGIPALTGFMNQVLSYLPNVLAALLIFIVAAAVAGAVAGLVHRTMGETPTGKIVGTLVPAMIMGIAVFMILTQLGISPVIVTITYVALVGAAALAAALAFGIGGRDAAAKLVNSGYEKAKEQNDTIKSDLAIGKQRAAQDAADTKHKAEQKMSGQEQSAPPAQSPPTPATGRAYRP